MKLEKFTKNKNQKRIIIGSIIVLILLVGGIYLYRTYALYEEKKEFNVLKGRIPDFSYLTVKYVVEGVETTAPDKDNHVFSSITCSGVENYSWDDTNWKVSYNTGNLTSKEVSCTVTLKKIVIASDVLKLGDYVSMTPASTNYTISKSLTGYSQNQTINPSELNLWRVIKINGDGTIEMVSEYTSSKSVSFYGETGYKNYVGVLNTIAAQYANNKYTKATRYMGYKNQTQYLSSVASVTSFPRGQTSNNNYETIGGGDVSYTGDTTLVTNALRSLACKRVGSSASASYFLASRTYYRGAYNPNFEYYWYGVRSVNTSGYTVGDGAEYKIRASDLGEMTISNYIRPIVTLKSDVKAVGLGSSDDPYKLL